MIMVTVAHDMGAAAKPHHQDEQPGEEQEIQDVL